MIAAMSIVIVAWIVVFCLLAGVGQVIRGMFGVGPGRLETWFDAFWLGFVAVIALLQVWHLVLPIDWRTCAVVTLASLASLIWAFRYRERLAFSPLRLVIFVLVLAPVAVWFAYRALSAQMDYDSGLYHMATIRWTNEYPAVPGLGNLHYRLAFNQSFFLFVAALNVFPFFNQGFHVANSLLMIVLAAQLIHVVVRVIFSPRDLSAYHLLSAFLLPILVLRAGPVQYSANMSSPSPDLSVFILQIAAGLAFVKYLFVPNPHEKECTVFTIVAVAIVGVTMKLSIVVFSLSLIGLIATLWLWQNRQRLNSAARQVALWLIVAGWLIGLPWLAHGIITSGYPFFPSTVGALPVDYRVPAPIATDAADWVRSFARDPRGDMAVVLSNWDWLPSWFGRMHDPFSEFLFVYPFYAFVIFLAIDLIVWGSLWLFRKHARPDPRLWLPFLPASASALFWFISAPDPRFAGSVFWIMALWGLTVFLVLLPCIPPVPALSRILKPGLISRAVVILPAGGALVVVAMAINSGVNLEGPGFVPIPITATKPYQTESGLLVNMAANPDFHLQLWDAPLPASPYEMPHLQLRGSDLRSGFRMPEP